MAVTNVDHQETRTARVPYRLSIETAGVMILLLGAWTGLIGYVAPAFSFSADGAGSWTWNLAHTYLLLVPGAAAVLAGTIIMVKGLSRGRGRRALLGFAGLLAAVCGAWLVVGPFAWQVLEGTPFFVAGASALRDLTYFICYSFGPGGLLLALGAFVLGRPHPTIGDMEQ
jgi:hypothetical protein